MIYPKVLMFGWEWPPFNSGGLGVACQGLVFALAKAGLDITFVLPKKIPIKSNGIKFVFAGLKNFYNPYKTSKKQISCSGLLNQVLDYARLAKKIAESENFDIIHSHDWLCGPAGIIAKKVSKKPLCAHIHATEFDRCGGSTGINQDVFKIEKSAMQKADKIFTVSNFTKNIAINNYNIPEHKITPVYNGINYQKYSRINKSDFYFWKNKGYKIVVFVGRLALQKGPEYFLRAAQKVLEHRKKTLFIIAGSGDMMEQLIQEANYLNISDKVLFAGFLRGDNLARIYQAADLFVMPSVSEPFGLVPLEALMHRTPVLISKQSGVSEILNNALKVDFWDINAMSGKILAVLKYSPLKKCLINYGHEEVKSITWDRAAQTCIYAYKQIL